MIIDAYRILITKTKSPTYWYARNVGEEFWVTFDNNKHDFTVVNEGVFIDNNTSERYIDVGDATIIRSALLNIEQHTFVQVKEVSITPP